MNALRTPRKSEVTGLGGQASKTQKQPPPGRAQEASRWYLLLALSLLCSILLFPDILTGPQSTYKQGDIALQDIKAKREFLVEDPEVTEENRQEAARAVPPLYDMDPTAGDLLKSLQEAFAVGRAFVEEELYLSHVAADSSMELDAIREDGAMNVKGLEEYFFGLLGIPLDHRGFSMLFETGFPYTVERLLVSLLSQLYDVGVVGSKLALPGQKGKGIVLRALPEGKEREITDLSAFHDVKGAQELIGSRGKVETEGLKPAGLGAAVVRLAQALVRPNLIYNKKETEARIDLARKSVTPFYFKVKKGEMLVREGERIDTEDVLKLTEHNKFLKTQENLGRIPAMALLIAGLILFTHLAVQMRGRQEGWTLKDHLFGALSLLLVFFLTLAVDLVSEETTHTFGGVSGSALLYSTPVASGAMLVAIFRGSGAALGFSVVISALASLVFGGRVEVFIYFLGGCLVGAYYVRRPKERVVFIVAGIRVGVVNMLMALAIELLMGSPTAVEILMAMLSGFTGGVLVGILTSGLLPLIELSFGYTTDIKLLELANLDQILLKELMVQAPGTYHHSVIVANMVEAAAGSIGANPLFAKVAAYYHDIGKTRKPLYFIENQMGKENRHEKLAPSMSSLILISHVKDGVELARRYKLGSEIRDIIAQHHGTSLISFFYEKARELEEKRGIKPPTVKEEDFRYPGPKPQTKEAGLVMLGDAVEAASRTLSDPTSARIQGLVQRIINRFFSDGQLDECELTLKDLHLIAKSFNKTLSGIFHHRVEYPEQAQKQGQARVRQPPLLLKAGAEPRKGEDGHPDTVRNGDSPPKKAEAKGQPEEGLKRLGLS